MDRAYIGTIHGSEFFLRRHIEYRNAFLPRIQGKITSSNNGSTVCLHFEMSKSIYYVLMISNIAAILICGLIMLIEGTSFGLIPIGAFLSLYGLGLLIFYKGVTTSKKHFLQITEGRVNKNRLLT